MGSGERDRKKPRFLAYATRRIGLLFSETGKAVKEVGSEQGDLEYGIFLL